MYRFYVLFVFVACCFAQVSFKASVRIYGDPKIPNSVLTGTMNYFYNNTHASATNHNIRIDYGAPHSMTEQWVYKEAVHYRYCTKCEAETYKIMADQYFPLSTDVKVTGSVWNGCEEFVRSSGSVRQIWVHPTTKQVCKLAISGTTGQRTIEFSNVAAVDSSALVAYKNWNCPSPTCNRVLDLVLVIDESGSINADEWKKLIDFAKSVVSRYRMGAEATAIGVVFFGTANRIVSYLDISADNVNKALETTKKGGNTCIGCGITVGHNYVFNNIPSTKLIPGRAAKNPAKLMIVLTDGENNVGAIGGSVKLNLTNAAANARNANITLAAIGVDGYKEDELKLIASTITGQQLIFKVSQFDMLGSILDDLIKNTCNDLPVSTCGTTCFGFCSCNSVCSCPVCSQDTMCSKYTCKMNSDGSTTGCQRSDVDCTSTDLCKVGTCDPALGCQLIDKNCDDGDQCTVDSCQDGQCSHVQRNCDDGKDCTRDSCSASVAGGCLNILSCDTGSVCFRGECGEDGKCTMVPAVDCDDHNLCTNDYCDPKNGCQVEPVECQDDGLNCTIESCDPKLGCLRIPLDCDDHDICTKDTCVEGFGCQYDEIDCTACTAYFEAGGECVPIEPCTTSTCKDNGQGVAECEVKERVCPESGNKCATPFCDIQTNNCSFILTTCAEKPCLKGKCNPDTGDCDYEPIDCSSSDPCFIGYCDNETGTCKSETFCKSKTCKVVTCEASEDRKTATCPETDFDCSSGTECLIGSCDQRTGKCVFADVTCVDELFCTDDLCDPVQGCVFPNKTCDDGDPCTLDFCDEANEECYHEFACDDGLFCTDDWCGPSGECIHSPFKCNVKFTDSEVKCFIPECIEEKDKCEKRLSNTAILDVCGNCLDVFANESLANDTAAHTACVGSLTWPKFAATLTGAAVAGIIIAAIIGAIIIALSSFFGARELIKRAKSAQDQGAVNNPVYEASGKEMNNPAFGGDS